MKKNQSVFIILFFFVTILFVSNNSQAMTNEGHVGGGGLESYPVLFEDSTGILIVTSNFKNNSGIENADITVVSICFDANAPDGIDRYRPIRLRVYDSDMNEFFDPDSEQGMGTKERRLNVRPHRDRPELLWTVQVTNDEATIIFAEMTLLYYYDPEAVYDPVISTTATDVIKITEHEEKLQKQKIWDFAGYTISGGLGVLCLVFYIKRRH